MNLSLLATAFIAAYSAASIAYVYRWRGRVRYASFAQYARKSWPVFAPLNCLMYLTTQPWARQPVLDAGYLENIGVLRAHWTSLRDEALALHASGALDAARYPGSAGYHDVGFRTFYKRGWSKFYLKWYGSTHRSAQRLCPATLALLDQVPAIRGAMFSVLPPGTELSLHSDPMACSFRYHLALATPNSERCRIEVDGQPCPWYDGEDFVFDETYPHTARNDTPVPRIILLCDVDRPMNATGRVVHAAYRLLARATVVPNTPEDERGLFSMLFRRVAPWRERALYLRDRNRALYKALKLTLNTTLLGALGAVVFAVLNAVEWILF